LAQFIQIRADIESEIQSSPDKQRATSSYSSMDGTAPNSPHKIRNLPTPPNHRGSNYLNGRASPSSIGASRMYVGRSCG
jgi:hypothetical protein